jgi:hypothetical protein
MERINNQRACCVFPDGLLRTNVLHVARWAGHWAIDQQEAWLLRFEPANEQFL